MSNFLIIKGGSAFRNGAGIEIDKEAAIFTALCGFLNAHGLAVAPLPVHGPGQWDDFALRVNDVNETGLALIRAGLDKWLRGIDRGKAPEDVSLLQKALEKLQN
ncbi:hypothetical protein [Massilia sp. erpn]|uniref:hypothetical protein n=1 Tax=Massilia sp. erpn TaxID=2738142 RepID=UPI0021082685|nr:hypothetical protein [Massilia sp. erpn]UTY55834.1 hypothetical protein HPQ68_00730 [Massilia sp. erpn]